MFADSTYPRARRRARPLAVPGYLLTGAALLSAALVIGLATAADYGFTIDEFNTDDYGPKALAWYTSGFTDRSHFETVEEWLWAYGPWAQIVIAFAQSLHIADPLAVRHAITFTIGLAGLAALIPLARMTVGRWGGPVAIVLCLMTGYLYGHLFFTPIDVPFMTAMLWGLVAVVAMARHAIPPWPLTILTGLATGLAIATRTGGIITHAYLVLAMGLVAFEAVLLHGAAARRQLIAVAVRTATAMAVAWAFAIALWPWLQIGNPFRQFMIAYTHFTTIQAPFEFNHWGERIATSDLPWSYIPMQLLARLPEGFLLLLAAALLIGLAVSLRFARATALRVRMMGLNGLHAPLVAIARRRTLILLVAAAVTPPAFVIINGTTMYDGIRHLLFIVPLLAVIAAGALVWLLPRLAARPMVAAGTAVLAAAHLGATALTLASLHPLQYTAINALAGGTAAEGRFEQDYWAAGATEALRQLERRLDNDKTGRFAGRKARILICIPWREQMVSPMLRRHFVVETDPAKADFMIGTERWDCGKEAQANMIDEVERLGRGFAWTYVNNPGTVGQGTNQR